MNYFGHAAVASHYVDATSEHASARNAFVLGATLPDLVNMSGLGVSERALEQLLRAGTTSAPAGEKATLLQGVAFHTSTDAVFHPLPGFVENNNRTLLSFRAEGIRRGPARALAHVGVEMQIDAHLAESAALVSAWEQALTWGLKEDTIWAAFGEAGRKHFISLLSHLKERGHSVFTATAARFSFRLGNMLKGRPRLEPSADELLIACKYLEQTTPDMKSTAFAIVAQSVEHLRIK